VTRSAPSRCQRAVSLRETKPPAIAKAAEYLGFLPLQFPGPWNYVDFEMSSIGA